MIDWEEVVRGYNRIYKTDFTDQKQLLTYLWNQCGSTRKVARVLGEYHGTVEREMVRQHVKRTTQADQCLRPAMRVAGIPKGIRTGMTIKEIAVHAKCSRTAVYNFLKKERSKCCQ